LRARRETHDNPIERARGRYISPPGLDRGIAQSLVEESERLCRYSKAMQGNVDVVFNVI
jgi:organic hydroperoxide reductase OsmC/OhrA